MKKFKRILALAIALAMALTMMSVAAFAETVITYEPCETYVEGGQYYADAEGTNRIDSTVIYNQASLNAWIQMNGRAPYLKTETEQSDPPVVEPTDDTYTITITAPEGHTYEVFQVFTGTPEDGELTGLRYGQNTTKTAGTAVSQDDMADLQRIQDANLTDEQTIIDNLKGYVDFVSTPIRTIESGAVAEALAPGYYLIRDKKSEVPGDEGETLYMLKVLDANLETSAKSDKPSSDKSVATPQTNASDYSIGDTIPYFLTFTLPSDYAHYKQYYVRFDDKLDDGLTYNGDAEIFYGASDDTGEAIDFGTKDAAGATLSYEIADLKADSATAEMKALKAGDVITIKYTAFLNDDAKFGKEGNKNVYSVTFSRNPNQDGGGTPETGETPKDTTIVFTYKTIFDKIDQDGNKLTGADFKLEKWVDGQWVDVVTLNNSAKPAKIGSSAENSTQFTFQGLDAGKYQLTETFTPAGYNTMDPIEFEITADVDGNLNTSAALKNLFSSGLVMTSDVAAGSLTTSIKNQTGVALPETGGIGTTIFYVVGAILVIGAGVVLITRRRMSA
ncbi:MAG: isopeptide-forming domain-containing fimbrial protein [Oscillospiraceae bacterium]|nr:isopeptide-forming domain-containing fimbrial protein [Oscillospiraceae bacterium]